MKTLVLSVILLISLPSFSQTTEVQVVESPAAMQDKVYTVVEQMPAYPGGEQAMMRFIQQHITYPDMERENDIQGRVVIKFIVNEDGSLSDIKVAKGVSAGLDGEALRVIRMMPRFSPGKQQGKAVKVTFMLPIMFKLADPQVAPAVTDTLPHALPALSSLASPSPAGTAAMKEMYTDPVFKGGNAAITEYINKNNKLLRKTGYGKRIYISVMATIDEKGHVSDAVVSSSGFILAHRDEAIRVVKTLPRFKPATRSGKAITSFYYIPVLFLQ